jgi:hypothetical protein
MKGIRIAVLGLGAAAALVALAGCGSSKTHGEEGTVKVISPKNATHLAFIGKPTKKGFPAGSGIAVDNEYQSSEKKPVGELDAVCIATQPSKSLSGTCSATAVVPGGTFALNAGGKEILNGHGVSGAIVGGTGKFAGAVGTFASKTGNGETTVFSYTLP